MADILEKANPLPPRRHIFSHFHLDYRPLIHRTEARHAVAEPETYQWVDPSELAGMGTPAPVKTLLDELAGRQSDLFG